MSRNVQTILCLITSFLFLFACVSDSYCQTSGRSSEAGLDIAACAIGVAIGFAIGIPLYFLINKKKTPAEKLNAIFKKAEDYYEARNYPDALKKYSEFVDSYDQKNASSIGNEIVNRHYAAAKEKIEKLKSSLKTEPDSK
jgi:hypothetical protein